MNDLNVYQMSLKEGSPVWVIYGERVFVELFASKKDIEDEFDGSLLLTDMNSGKEFIGVYGKRNLAKFRKFLVQRGAEVQVVKKDSVRRRIKLWTRHYRRAARVLK
jgi:hypothetical protein